MDGVEDACSPIARAGYRNTTPLADTHTHTHTHTQRDETKRRRSQRRASRLDQSAVGWLRTPSAVINSGSPSALVSLLAAVSQSLVRLVEPCWCSASAGHPRPEFVHRLLPGRFLVASLVFFCPSRRPRKISLTGRDARTGSQGRGNTRPRQGNVHVGSDISCSPDFLSSSLSSFVFFFSFVLLVLLFRRLQSDSLYSLGRCT